jgi:hypothetical protein
MKKQGFNLDGFVAAVKSVGLIIIAFFDYFNQN